jgi:hypothetical protein
MVRNGKPQRVVYLSNGFDLPIIWRKILLQVFRSMDAPGIYCGDLQE